MISEVVLLKTGIAIMAIVNPIGALPVFIASMQSYSEAEKVKAIRIIGFTVFTILTLALFLGDGLLSFFGVSVPAFKVGGGILLLLMAINMMHSVLDHTERDASSAVVPLGTPLLAGPGAISSVIMLSQSQPHLIDRIPYVFPIFVVSALVVIILATSSALARIMGNLGLNIVQRLMGLMLAAISVEFIADGVKVLLFTN